MQWFVPIKLNTPLTTWKSENQSEQQSNSHDIESCKSNLICGRGCSRRSPYTRLNRDFNRCCWVGKISNNIQHNPHSEKHVVMAICWHLDDSHIFSTIPVWQTSSYGVHSQCAEGIIQSQNVSTRSTSGDVTVVPGALSLPISATMIYYPKTLRTAAIWWLLCLQFAGPTSKNVGKYSRCCPTEECP